MTELFYGKVSSVNYSSGSANITLQDRENQVIQGVPFLSMFYEMPKPGDVVAVLFEDIDGQLGKGVVLGKIFAGGNTPRECGPGIFLKEFADGASIKYTPDLMELELNLKKVIVDEVEYRTATQKE